MKLASPAWPPRLQCPLRPALVMLAAAITLAWSTAAFGDEHCDPSLPSWRSSWDPENISALSAMLYGGGAAASAWNIPLGIGVGLETPDPLRDRDLALDGFGWLAGWGVRATFQSDSGIRVGFGMGMFYLDGPRLFHDPLPVGVSAEHGEGFVVQPELFVGKAFDARHAYPYIDLVALFNVVLARLDLHIADHGFVGSTTAAGFSFGLAPRVGAFIPLDGDWFIDVSGHYGMFGLDRMGAQMGIGMWDDL